MELLETKIIAIVTLAIGSLLVGTLPACVSSYGRNRHPLFISALLCFGGGVLLSTSLVHMLPEIRENLPTNKECAEILFAIGFFMLYFIDEFIHVIYPTHLHGNQIEANSTAAANKSALLAHRNYAATEASPLLLPQPAYNPTFVRFSMPEPGPSGKLNETSTDPRNSQLCHIIPSEPCRNKPVGSFGLLFALCVHALLEGLAVGLETSSSQVLLLFAAIASHKLVVCFCLGMELSTDNTFLRHFFLILIFSLGSPLGIGCGMIFTHIPEDVTNYLLPIMQGLAGGTLFYVSVSEVLPRERAQWHNNQQARKYAGFCQFFSVILGFAIMTLLNRYLDN